jgi:beta-glucosidase
MNSIASLTIEEKASLGSGASFWESKAVGEVSGFSLADGPHGVRKQAAGASDSLGISASAPATCFPPAAALAQAWNPELSERVGAALGDEAQAAGVGVLLGPGINIKRDPRCGRNFEYLSEDPLVSGILGAAWVRGLQSRGVGASVKHFAANNAETDRMRASSDVDARTLREIYLRAFQRVVAEASPWTVMCSYNRINGVFASQNHWLLTEVLRDEWGFDGVVVSDWGAVTDRPAAVAAGLDLEMPATGGRTDAQVVAAVGAGELALADVDRAAERVAQLSSRIEHGRRADATVDVDAHHRFAREAAAQSIVLLKNEDGILPLQPGESVAAIGEFARRPRYQGGGSSHVTPTRLDVPLDEIRSLAGGTVTYAAGFTTDGSGDAAALRAEAVDIARGAGTAVVFLGLGESQESEGFDRDDIELPADQLALFEAVVAVQPRTVVVLSHGGVLRLEPVAELAPAILDGALLGQAGGGAIADVLFGLVNPSARLTETVPVRLEDVPAFVNFPGEQGHVQYGERIFVGYRWYDQRDLAVTFPFGHGLSYTHFAYSSPVVVAHSGGVTVTVDVTNTGDRAGREVVQVYAGLPGSSISRARRGLVGFEGVQLAPGETRSVGVEIRRADLAYWDVRVDRWIVEGGDYEISVGASSRDLRGTVSVAVDGDPVWLPLSFESTMGEVFADPIAGPVVSAAMAEMTEGADLESMGAAMGFDVQRVIASMPIRATVGQMGDEEQVRQFQQLLDLANAQHGETSTEPADDEDATAGTRGKGKPLTARSSVRAWLKHPVGGKLLRDLLAQGGVDERLLTAVKLLPLQQLVSLSGGQLPQSIVDDMVAKVGAARA